MKRRSPITLETIRQGGRREAKNAKALDEAGRFLEQNPFGMAVVASYSHFKGDSAKERQVTAARSVVARDYLVNHFKVEDTNRIKTIGEGKSADAPDGGTVEVMVYPAAGKTP